MGRVQVREDLLIKEEINMNNDIKKKLKKTKKRGGERRGEVLVEKFMRGEAPGTR